MCVIIVGSFGRGLVLRMSRRVAAGFELLVCSYHAISKLN